MHFILTPEYGGFNRVTEEQYIFRRLDWKKSLYTLSGKKSGTNSNDQFVKLFHLRPVFPDPQ